MAHPMMTLIDRNVEVAGRLRRLHKARPFPTLVECADGSVVLPLHPGFRGRSTAGYWASADEGWTFYREPTNEWRILQLFPAAYHQRTVRQTDIQDARFDTRREAVEALALLLREAGVPVVAENELSLHPNPAMREMETCWSRVCGIGQQARKKALRQK